MIQTFLVQPETCNLIGKYHSDTCVALIIHLELPDVFRNSWCNPQTAHECVKLCLTLARCSASGLLGAAPSAAWSCSEHGSSARTLQGGAAVGGCTPALCDFLPSPPCMGAGHAAGSPSPSRAGRGALSRAWLRAAAAAALQEWCPQVSGLSSVSDATTGLELWVWIPSGFWGSCDVLLTSYDQKHSFWITHGCVCYIVGVWASDWRLLVWATLWWRLFQGWRYDSFEVL